MMTKEDPLERQEPTSAIKPLVVVLWLVIFACVLIWQVLTSSGIPRFAWFAVLLLLLSGFLWQFPCFHVAQFKDLDAEKRFDKENESRKTIAQIFAGTAVLIGLWSASEQLKLSREAIRVSEQG